MNKRPAAVLGAIVLGGLVHFVITTKADTKAAGGVEDGKAASSRGSKLAEPFSLGYTLNRSEAGFFADGDTINTLQAGGRFYWGAQPLPGGMGAEFDRTREEKIDEILRFVDEAVAGSERLQPQLARLRDAFLNCVGMCRKLEPKGWSSMQDALKELMRLRIKQTIAHIASDALKSSEATDAFAKAAARELRFYNGMDAATLCLQETDFLTVNAAVVVLSLSSHSNQEVKAASVALDTAMQEFDKMQDHLQALTISVQKARYALLQLETADYYYARSVTEFIRANLPEIKAKLKTITPNEFLNSSDKQFVAQCLEHLDKWNVAMLERLDAVKEDSVARVAVRDVGLVAGIAFAADGQDLPSYSTGYQMLNKLTTDIGKVYGPPARFAWDTVKTGVHKLQRGVQLTADTMGFVANSSFRAWTGIYYGNSTQSISADIRKYEKELVDNWKGKLPEKTTLRTARESIEKFEEYVDKSVYEDYRKGIITGKIPGVPYIVGKLSRFTVATFTGLGKGILAVSDPTSTAAELAGGSVEILFAATGGSKVIFKGSDITKSGADYLTRKRLPAEIARLEQLLAQGGDDFAKTLGTLRELSASRELLRELQKTGSSFRTALAEYLKSRPGESLQTIKSTFGELFEDKFEKSIGGLIEATASSTVGGSIDDLADNLVATQGDSLIGDTIAGLFEEPVAVEEIGGTYKGELTISDIKLPSKKPDKPKPGEEGCLDGVAEVDLEKVKGKPFPATLTISPPQGRSGTVTLAVSDKDKPVQTPYVYTEDGRLRFNVTQKGSTAAFDGRFKKTASGIAIEGKFVAKENDGSITISWKGKK